MSKRKNSRIRNTVTPNQIDQGVMNDVEYISTGGWRGAIGELVYQLRVCRGHWLDEADCIERLLQSNKNPDLNEEQVLLRRIQEALASVRNHPKLDLTERLQIDLSASVSAAIRATFLRLQSISAEAERKDEAERGVETKIASLLKEANDAYRPLSEFQDDLFRTIKDVNKVLAENPWIRSRRPKGKNGKEKSNRKEIHAGDWHKFKQQGQTEDLLDQNADVVDAVMDAEKRKADIRQQKSELRK